MSDKTKKLIAGGVGGVLPTSVTLATMLTSDPTSRVIEDITLGFYAGLALFLS
ncbi:hypothetical protein H1X87_25165 [Vibrio parahaemolyticus]|nr:hypothetical protein [Vibrio parahaemolyticus]MBC8664209.1 hypothetical protein [Vibrio parahaemolyticus]MBC8664222.1 hypothetical protein [Vibrio parahaemolyticus]MBC8664349.1 hypothetical protein [Vibrio parahaemolyticus]MBC8664354.1 hypothetical protein [Vibrio parahaemolyticus]MBC8664381.1 hypothetical protein [Vibrio parahaemolyticus]